jgi:SAM-dependent methyltransferase
LTFDPDLVPYDASYENSQHFSPRFARYAQELAASLVARHGLHDRAVAEIGSGKGEFLAELCQAGVARAYAYDASYAGEIDQSPHAGRIEFVRRDWDSQAPMPDVELVCCRHVLEHFVDPASLLAGLRRSLDERRVPVYFEVPNGEFVLTRSGMWDFIYQHVSYFTPVSLEVLFTRCGFEVTDLGDAFDGQFLSIEATPTGRPAADPATTSDLTTTLASIEHFAARYEAAVDAWNKDLSSRNDVVVWGAGSKGVTFLNTTDARHAVFAVVDLNPRKQGAYVAGTAHPIVAPEHLIENPPGKVIVANPAYLDEVCDRLRDLGLSVDVASL